MTHRKQFKWLIPGFCFVSGITTLLTAPASLSTDQTALIERFDREIYPLLTRGNENSCVSCHDAEGSSELILVGNVRDDFLTLKEGGFFNMNNLDTVFGRVTSTNPKKRMPKGRHARQWSPQEVERLSLFLSELAPSLSPQVQSDQTFPASLLLPYTGPVKAGRDYQFITYRQLQGKIKTIFSDNGDRADRNLFSDNVALFGGADFEERFNESTQPSSSFFTALDTLARDVAARSYSQKSGPFRERRDQLPDPGSMTKPDAHYRQEIAQVYEAILFRPPTPEEYRSAFQLIRGIYEEKDLIQQSDYDLGFKLTVRDPQTGFEATRRILIPVRGDTTGIYQEWIDQSKGDPINEDQNKLVKHTLRTSFQFERDHPSQRFVLHNAQTFDNVSFAGIELRNIDSGTSSRILADHPSVQPEGAWKLTNKKGIAVYDDESLEKGRNQITVPIRVPEEGTYELSLLWYARSRNDKNVLVEVFAMDPNQLALPALPELPEMQEASFFYDCSDDTRPYAELDAWFEFGEDGYVEINNQDTHARVTAGAMVFVPRNEESAFTIDSLEAEGSESWKSFSAGQFKAYNREGTQLHDNNEDKGKRFLRFKPSSRKAVSNDDEKMKEKWRPGQFYKVRIHYPGKKENERRTPVRVKAQKSSPIIQLAHTPRAKAEGILVINASASYTVQRNQLEFEWKQTQGVPVSFNASSPELTVQLPRRQVQQAAWEALCRALMRHPDFLFTRAPSLDGPLKGNPKRNLQWVRICLDLMARAPKQAELEQIKQRVSLESMVQALLDTQEFRDFYFHRIRLYLESQGTELQDEPARLWCYVAFNDRPFQEILTADYTVDVDFNKQSRPDHHGRSGLLTTRGFIEGKPGLPHYNYAAQVSMLFLGYVYEVPPEIVEQREGVTALGTTDPNSVCYSCHKILTPLAMQRNFWSDDGFYRTLDDQEHSIDASDQNLVEEYPFKGTGMQAFAVQAVKKERFIRTIINTHFNFYFGRSMRHRTDERGLYKRLWDSVHQHDFQIRKLIFTLITSPEYLENSRPLKGHTQLSP